MTLLLAIAVLCMPPVPEIVLEDRVDVLEVNHATGVDDGFRYEQIIGWDWSADHQRYDIVFWLATDKHNLPRPSGEEYASEWREGYRITRRVFAAERWERWLDYDIERRDQGVLPTEQRRQLSELRATTPSASDLVTP